jgi:hypothetical protein
LLYPYPKTAFKLVLLVALDKSLWFTRYISLLYLPVVNRIFCYTSAVLLIIQLGPSPKVQFGPKLDTKVTFNTTHPPPPPGTFKGVLGSLEA